VYASSHNDLLFVQHVTMMCVIIGHAVDYGYQENQGNKKH